MKYVLLLRGVNVGGQRQVPMARLRDMLQALGYADVVTYINSGNVVFSSDTSPSKEQVSRAIHEEFGFDVPVLILSAENVIAIASAIPADWTNNRTEQKADVLYLFDEVNSPEILQQINGRPEFEELMYVDHAVLSRVERRYQTKSSLLKLMGTDLYKKITIRNVTTARVLAEMVRQS
jgi:uncharacterized protein (DUF1697 family)